jgi:hypothetical protein
VGSHRDYFQYRTTSGPPDLIQLSQEVLLPQDIDAGLICGPESCPVPTQPSRPRSRSQSRRHPPPVRWTSASSVEPERTGAVLVAAARGHRVTNSPGQFPSETI